MDRRTQLERGIETDLILKWKQAEKQPIIAILFEFFVDIFFFVSLLNTLVGCHRFDWVNMTWSKWPGTRTDWIHDIMMIVADVAGQRIKGIGRITGLNPSGPNFDQLPPDQRLDRTDALFVGQLISSLLQFIYVLLSVFQRISFIPLYSFIISSGWI